jgi:hypothetical protein
MRTSLSRIVLAVMALVVAGSVLVYGKTVSAAPAKADDAVTPAETTWAPRQLTAR